MYRESNSWALVLAAGEGTRLRSLTTTRSGASVPKQFCSLRGGLSLFHQALQRAHSLATRSRTCAVVARQHWIWWQGLPRGLPTSNVIVQPRNRGTANGILLPLLHIVERDPQAEIVILPSDHHVSEEQVLARSLRCALQQLRQSPVDIILLGFQPNEPDCELGYILPAPNQDSETLQVERFVEKPLSAEAQAIIERGGLWNAFIVAATAQSLLNLFRRQRPQIIEQMRAAILEDQKDPEAKAIELLYQRLPTIDFSRDILEGQEKHLRVLPVPNCGWSDLGTPRRVERVLGQSTSASGSEVEHLDWSYLSLAAQLAGRSEKSKPGQRRNNVGPGHPDKPH
jgi:mannose-1-phosphate guanylyltransferase